MEQMLLLYESEKAASALVQSVIHALPMRTVGFRLLPYAIAGQPRGELIHFLASDDPVQNDVPCTLRLSREKIVSIDAVWAELAAPALLRCLPRRAPILLDHLTAPALAVPAFAGAVKRCFAGESPVLALAPQSLSDTLSELLHDAPPMVFSCTDENAQELVRTLTNEISLRL